MKKRLIILISIVIVTLSILLMVYKEPIYNASDYGVLPSNEGSVNSRNLQALIDNVSIEGGSIYIPSGVYCLSQNGSQTIGDHCLKMRSNICIFGDGDSTILKPEGFYTYGLDVFYFNDYLDNGEPNYLENCTFRDFVIDASNTSCQVYTSAGKGFMFNLIRNCHWENVTVINTDATGFGVDCPIDCTISNCKAIGCGKAGTEDSPGASGFGIGYGYAADEVMTISESVAIGCKKFGFFFEHQGRFDEERYSLVNQGTFLAAGCYAKDNLYNYGGICAQNIRYSECVAEEPGKQNYYFENCLNCHFE